jgi:hypothetical protein
MDKEILKKVGLDDLVQVSSKDIKNNQRFQFLGLGQIRIDYDCEIKKTDPFIARLAGADDEEVSRVRYSNVVLNMDIPSKATHYLLGTPVSAEEMYRSTGKSFSYDYIPIAFLKHLNRN